MLFRFAIIAAAAFFVGDSLQFDLFARTLFAASAICLALFVESLVRYRRRVGVGRAGERAVAQLLSELGVDVLHDIHLPSERGSRQIDHVALFPGSLAVLETKTYNGSFELHADRPWLRIGRYGRRYAVGNPLWQMEGAKAVLAAHLPEIRVWGLVVLAGRYRTTNGHPPNVLSREGLRDYIVRHRAKHGAWRHSAQILAAWQRLKELKDEHAGLAKTHVLQLRKRRGDRFYSFEDSWPLWLWGSLAAEALILSFLARAGLL